MKKINVIVPIFNGERYLKRCLDSLFCQTYNNLMIICVNDGSTDKTKEILSEYNNKNLVVINKTNGGVSSARNKALDYLKNKVDEEYLAFIDCDDFVDKDYFEKLVNMLETNDVDISCCSFSLTKTNHVRQFKQIDHDRKMSCFEATKTLLEDRTIQSHSPCKLFKAFLWNNIRFPLNIVSMEDQATIFKAFALAKNGVFVSNYSGYYYWQEGFSACRSEVTNKKALDSLLGYLEPFIYNNFNFGKDEIVQLKNISLNSIANVYLMMLPHLSKRTMSLEEKEKYYLIKSTIKTNRAIRRFVPKTKSEKLKKLAYLYARPFYKVLYKLFK